MAELQSHTRDTVRFALAHTGGVTRVELVLVSAWNEYDEGHWVCRSLHSEPTPTAKLEAIQDGITEAHRLHVRRHL